MIYKKNATIFVFCLLTSNVLCCSDEEINQDTTSIPGNLLAVTAQSIDYILPAVVCLLTGQAVLKSGIIRKHIPHTPEIVTAVENHIPGKSMARHTVTYLAVGAVLYTLINKAFSSDTLNGFLTSNMPNLSGILNYINAQVTQVPGALSNLEQVLENDLKYQSTDLLIRKKN